MAAPGYYLLLEGKLPGPDEALKELRDLPPGKSKGDKYFYGIERTGKYIGCFDLVQDYPEPKIGFIGLLLFVEPEQGKSHGAQVLKYIKRIAGKWGSTRLRVAVVGKNRRALNFWKREGFVELYRKPSERYSDDVIVMEAALTTSTPAT